MPRDWKIDLVWGVLGGLAALLVFLLLSSCQTDTAMRGALYADELQECNRTAKSLCESVACENRYRALNARPPRDVPSHCQSDAGTSEGGVK